ncbi:ketoacyl-ACP synthase III family protein [Kutzneria sp. NPDC052558]|uniref:ketoacyl-ACP synthase III family protein n=1 Tax=Kutzneria sp. NPDC052558 TaxID=3364121 RepID=UPI0037C90D3E
MRYKDLHVAGVGSWFPTSVPIGEAVADGRYNPEVLAKTQMAGVAVAGPYDPQPVMALNAGRRALKHAGLPGHQVSLLLHAVAGYNGLEAWNCASYLQNELLDGHGFSFEIRQLSNGAVGAVELAASFLGAHASRRAAVITTADVFPAPVWDRWTASPGLIFGDGASALVLSKDGGFAKVLSVASACDPALEGMQRGNSPFFGYADPSQYPVDIRARTHEFADVLPLRQAAKRMAEGLHAAADEACADAGLRIADVDHVVVPNFGRELLQEECLDPLGVDVSRTVWDWGREVGHVGAADQFAGLARLVETGKARPGETVLLVGVGGGFNWTCVLLRMAIES